MSDAPPPVRPDVEILPITHEGASLFLLQDPEGLAAGPLGVAPGGLAAAGLFDGKRTAQDVSDALFKETGQRVPAGVIQGLASELEKAGFLETPGVASARLKLLRDFKDSGSRKPAHLAGYPAGGLELSAFMGGFYSAPHGPGGPPPDKPAGAPPRGLFAPHIDLGRGGPWYAWSYRELAKAPPPDAIVALGVAHMSPDSPWTFTKKEYETPYGAMKVDADLYAKLSACLWYEPARDEWVHRREHSLEFQALWLRYLWKDACPPWVPILCSTFERWAPDKPPSAAPAVDEALTRMRAVLGERKNVLVLAGVDLAHVGPRFGDELELGPELRARVEKEDRASLAPALSGDADSMYSSVVQDGHWRKWCGLSACYTALRLMGESVRGELLSYGQASDPRGGLVSFASAVYR